MPRPWRQQVEGAKYHITARGNGRERLFYAAEDYERFLEQLQQALTRERVVLYAYTLMSNHYHLLIETPRGNLSKFMQRLNTAYGMYFRHKRRRPGHCLQGRFSAKRVDGEEYLVRLTRYIHLNPVKIRSLGPKTALERLEYLKSYSWSSAGGYAGWRNSEAFIDYRWLGLMRGRGWKRKRQDYARYLAECMEDDDEVLKEAVLESLYAIGEAGFVADVEEQARTARQEAGHFADLCEPVELGIPLEKVLAVVAADYGITSEELRQHGRRVGEAKTMALELACRVCGLSQRAIAEKMDLSEHAVSKQRKRLAAHLSQEPALQQRLEELVERVKSIV